MRQRVSVVPLGHCRVFVGQNADNGLFSLTCQSWAEELHPELVLLLEEKLRWEFKMFLNDEKRLILILYLLY